MGKYRRQLHRQKKAVRALAAFEAAESNCFERQDDQLNADMLNEAKITTYTFPVSRLTDADEICGDGAERMACIESCIGHAPDEASGDDVAATFTGMLYCEDYTIVIDQGAMKFLQGMA